MVLIERLWTLKYRKIILIKFKKSDSLQNNSIFYKYTNKIPSGRDKPDTGDLHLGGSSILPNTKLYINIFKLIF